MQAYFTPRNYKMTTVPLILASGTFTGVTIAKSVVSLKHKISLNHLQSFIKSLDEFGNCIKRNTTYFNEILMMKSIELIETRQIERAWDCITSSKEVIEILYDATRKMEENYILNEKYIDLYSSMEELGESEYFKKNVTDYTPKDIKVSFILIKIDFSDHTLVIHSPTRWNRTTSTLIDYRFEACIPDHRGIEWAKTY